MTDCVCARASSSRRYSIPAGVKAMVCWSSVPWIQRQPSSGSISVSQVPQELLVLAEDFGGAADGETRKPAPPCQAARATGIAWRQFHGSSAANSVIL